MIDYEPVEDLDYEGCENCTKCEEDDAGFSIVSDLQAEWALKKLKKAKEEHDRLVALAQEEIADYNRQIAILDQQLESATSFLKGKLYEYFNTVEHKTTKTQESYKLLSGSLVMKKASTKISKPDDEKLLNVLKSVDASEFIQAKEVPLWGEFKKTLTVTENGNVVDQNGEILDIEVKEEPAEFTIKF